MACPFCAASESNVVRSHGSVTTDRVRRRRQCAECGRRYPTGEGVDWALLERELGDTPEFRSLQPPPETWDRAEQLLHRVWGQAKDRDYVKADWIALQQVLGALKRQSPAGKGGPPSRQNARRCGVPGVELPAEKWGDE